MKKLVQYSKLLNLRFIFSFYDIVSSLTRLTATEYTTAIPKYAAAKTNCIVTLPRVIGRANKIIPFML